MLRSTNAMLRTRHDALTRDHVRRSAAELQ